jgi:hypothetical protein
MSNKRKKAARKVFMVRTNKLSAFQINSTGTIRTPRSRRAMVIIFSFALDMYLNSGTRLRVQGTWEVVQVVEAFRVVNGKQQPINCLTI